MAMKTREDALFNAYLNNYKAAQAQAVNSGVQATQAARQRGAALLNATDKTLPVLKNQLADVGTAAVAGANNDFKLAQQAAAMANDQFTKKLQDDADLAIQKQHEVWYLAKQAEKAAKAAKSSSSSKSGSVTTDSDSYAAMAAAADNLTTQGSTAAKDVQTKPLKGKDTQRSNAERNASARARYDGSEQEKSDIKYRVRQKREQTVQMLKDKQAAANAGANKGKPGGNSYAERQSAAQPAQSVATRRAGNLVGSTTAAAGQASSIRERRRAKATRNDWASVQKDTATALQRLQTDADYRAELGTPGRQLTQAEINAVNQYGQNAGDLYKQVQGGIISLDDYNTQAQALARMNQKASLNGMGQDLQAATAGFMRSFPLQKQSEQAFTDWADDQTSGKYSQAIDNGVLPALVPTLDKYAEQAPLAAMGGAMAGKMAQYNAFNQLVDGTGYADAAQKAGGKLYDAAKKIPVLNRIVQPGFGEAAGRVLADTGADFVLDTYPSMMDDMDKFSADRQTAARGENVDDPMTVGRMAANAAKNLAGNVAMNALPEIGSAVLNGAKNSFSGAMLDEPLQEAAAVAGKSSRLDTRPDLPRADTPAAVDLEKNADAFLRDANSADAVKSVPDSTAANFTSTPQNAAQGLADSAADAPGVAVRERGYAASLRTNSDLPDAVKQDFVTAPEVYNQLSNAETKARADAVLAKGQGEAVTAYQNMLSQHDPAAVPLGYELAKQYIADGDSDSAVELLRGMSKELTASGQFSQAAAISLMQNDPMTALRYAQRSIDDLNAGGAKELGRRWKNFSLTDANKRAFDKQNGFLPFAIHVPGTNVYYRISDFQPSMMSVITGAAWAQAASGDETPEQAAKGAVVAFTNTLADNSNLSNIGDLFGNYDGLGGGLWDAALGLPQSMVPSLSNAIAKSTDTTVRNPYDATDPIQSQKNQIMAKIPGLSKELPAAYDTWGAEKLRDNAAFEQFLDPAAFTNQTTSSRDKEIQRLYEATGDIGVYPPSIKNGTDVDGLKLDNTQTSEYQRTAGQLNRQIVDEVMRTDEYRQADDATRVKMLKSAYEIGR